MKKLFLLLPLLFLTGCTLAGAGLIFGAAGAAAQGYIIWKEGEATKYYNYDVNTMYRAVKHAADTLNLKLVSDSGGSSNNYLLKAGERDKFKIKIIAAEQGTTKVCIRVNFMGDKPHAELFYKTVDDQLNTIQFKQGKPTTERKKLLKFRRVPQTRTFQSVDEPVSLQI